ncbi:uncharacterized protein [Diadema setosum]|uniref:uncharacterized protein n=1 Tax=Diadema setosum TaxID=31175 RepID=UPI003B3ACDD3
MSAFIDKYLQGVLHNIESYVKDTNDFLNRLDNIQLPPNCTLVTLDVVSLYTNIPHSDGVNALRRFLTKHDPSSDMPIEDICCLAQFILKHNYFTFDDEYFLQTQDTAMGTKFAPAYASMFMAVLEEEFLSKETLKPSMFVRYIDDIFLIWPHTDEQLSEFHSKLNMAHPDIKFTMDSSR